MLVRHACLVGKPPPCASAVLAVIFRCCSCSWLLVLSHMLSDDGLYGEPQLKAVDCDVSQEGRYSCVNKSR